MLDAEAAHLHVFVGERRERQLEGREQLVTPLADRRPVVLRLEGDRRRHREVRRRIARPLPAMKLRERRVVQPVPRHDRRIDQPLRIGTRVEEARALRRAQPFVAVAGVDVGAERVQVEVELARRVRAVDDEQCSGGARAGDERREVVDAPRRPFDVRAEDDARARVRDRARRTAAVRRWRRCGGERTPTAAPSRRTRRRRGAPRRRARASATARPRSGRDVAFGTKARFSGAAPRYPASARRASSRSAGNRRSSARNSTGCRSSSRCQRW